MIRLFEKIKNLILDILFPNICLSCQKTLNQTEKHICPNCFQSISINRQKPIIIDKNINLLYVTSYNQKTVKNLIHKLKFKKLKTAVISLNDITNIFLKNQNLPTENSLLISIPLSKKRLRQRGFNQSELIAQNISKQLNIPLNKTLIKIKDTPPQSKLTISQRKNNIKNVFKLKNLKLQNKNIILVDDIYTSGYTINEAIKTLKPLNPKSLTIFTLAKT